MHQKNPLIFICFAMYLLAQSLAAQQALIVTTESPTAKESRKEGNSLTGPIPTVPEIYDLHIRSYVRNRYSNTTIVSKVRNLVQTSQEATFSVILPETAFISGFIMQVEGKNYTAYVKEKEEAKRDYDQAVASGIGAAHVAVSARDSNRFTVSVNVESDSKAAFYLNYEELLQRRDGRYEQILNIHPGQPVKNLSVEVFITETRRIIDLKTPPMRTGNEIGNDNPELDPRADLEIINEKTAVVRFEPNLERQKQLAYLLGTNENEGLAGQFVVQYDVARYPQGGEVLIQDGYFVHFFAPSELAPLPKHVVFVLDTSSSMNGQKIQQLKEAMHKILGELNENDLFNLVEFNSNVKVWDLNNPDASVWYPSTGRYLDMDSGRETHDFSTYNFPNAYLVNPDNIKKGQKTVSEFRDTGATDIYNALRVGLHLVELAKQEKIDNVERQSILVFLTDGEPTVGLRNAEEIINKISEFNVGARKSPIFTLSFGTGADKNFLQKLAIRNYGFAKHIYEAADAALQLQDFYKQISSPLLSNVHFKYEPSVTSLTKTEFSLHFGDSEIVVCGAYDKNNALSLPRVEAWGAHGPTSFKPNTVERSVSNIERLWAYMTIKQLLDKKEVAENDKEEIKKKALDLALKYSFVTPVSSLVVVKPNATNAVDTEEASEGNNRPNRPKPSPKYTTGPRSDMGSRFMSLSAISPPRFGAGDFSSVSYHSAVQTAGFSGPPRKPGYGYTGYTAASSSPHFLRPQYVTPPRTDHPRYPPVQHLPTTSMPSPTTLSPTSKVIQSPSTDLLVILPWLKNILNENGMLNLPSGNYKLGFNETVTDNVVCVNSPFNTTGYCSLLHLCPQVHSSLTNSDVFVQHFCVLKNEYAGVCCPNYP